MPRFPTHTAKDSSCLKLLDGLNKKSFFFYFLFNSIGNISEATDREKLSGKERGSEFEHQREGDEDADNEEVAADMATDEQAEKAQPV